MKYRNTLAILLISLGLSAQASELPSAQSIAACMRANLPTQFSVEDFILTSRTAGGDEEAISGQIYFTRDTGAGEPGLARAMMRIENPTPLRNSAYLIIETEDYLRDGLFVYLPALQRVRRVSGTMADGQLFGTDISYYDFKQFRNALGDMQASRTVERQTLDGRPVYRLHFTPRPDAQQHYEQVYATIDAETCVPRRLAIHEDGRLRKIFTVPVEAIKPYGERWYPAEFTMHDLTKDTRTTIRTLGFRADQPLSDKLFNPSTFYRTF